VSWGSWNGVLDSSGHSRGGRGGIVCSACNGGLYQEARGREGASALEGPLGAVGVVWRTEGAACKHRLGVGGGMDSVRTL
jgi:hypothetical protein